MLRPQPVAARCPGKPRIRILQTPKDSAAEPGEADQAASSPPPAGAKAGNGPSTKRSAGKLCDWASI